MMTPGKNKKDEKGGKKMPPMAKGGKKKSK